MHDEDVVKVAAAEPDAKIFVTHLEGVNHNGVTHEMVRKRAKVAGIPDKGCGWFNGVLTEKTI